MDPEKKSLNFIFPTKYGIPKNSKGWPLAKQGLHPKNPKTKLSHCYWQQSQGSCDHASV